MTKRIISVIIAAMIIVVALCGCSSPFTSGNAIKGQVGDLCYAVPAASVIDDDKSSENQVCYNIPIGNSTEEYTLVIYVSEPFDDEDEANEFFEGHLKTSQEIFNNGTTWESTFEDIYEFEGITIDKGYKRISESIEGNKVIEISFVKSKSIYQIGYGSKKDFFDESIWDNFCSQIKYVDH